jgi:hypothetical protein
MYSQQCRQCSNRIGSDGPSVLGPEGHYYHFTCWCQMMDVRVQEHREAIAKRQAQIAAWHGKRDKPHGKRQDGRPP